MKALLFFITGFFVLGTAKAQNDSLRLGLPLGHTKGINSLEESPDGRFLLTASMDNTAKLWDLESGRLVYSFDGKTHIEKAAFNSTGTHILISDLAGSAFVYNLESGKVKDLASARSFSFAGFDNQGKLVRTAGEDGVIRIYDLQGKLQKTINLFRKPISAMANSPMENNVIVALKDGGIGFVDLDKELIVSMIRGDISNVDKIKLSPNGQYAALTFMHQTEEIEIVDVAGKSILRKIKFPFDLGKVRSLAFSPDSKKLLVSYFASSVLWDIGTGETIHMLEGAPQLLSSQNFTVDNKKILFIGVRRKDISLLDLDKKAVIKDVNSPGTTYSAVFFNKKRTNVYATTADGAVEMWDIENNLPKKTLKKKTSKISSVIFSKTSENIFFASWDGTIKEWSPQTGELIHAYRVEKGLPDKVVLSPDGELMLSTSGGFDNQVNLWKLSTQELIFQTDYHKDYITSAGFNQDGSKFLLTSRDGSASLWDTESGSLLSVFKNSGVITNGGFNADGSMIYTLTTWKDYGEVKIWNSASCQLVKLMRFQKAIESVEFGNKKDEILVTFHLETAKTVFNIKSGLIVGQTDRTQWGDKKVLNRTGHISTEPSADGYFVLRNEKTGKQIARVFVFDGKEIMILTEDGYYKASPEAAQLLYYVNDDLQTIGFDQLDIKYNRPDKVLSILGKAFGNVNEELIEGYNRAWQKRIKKLKIDTTSFKSGFSVPESDILNRNKIVYEQTKDSLKLIIRGRDKDFKLDRYNVWINGVPVFGQNGMSIRSKNLNEINDEVTVTLSAGKNKIETSVMNVNGIESYRIPLYVNYTPEEKPEKKLYFIGIGIDHYLQSNYNLTYSGKDITDLATAMKLKYGNNIKVITLINQEATRDNILKIKKLLYKTNVNDKVIISFSGHGLLNKEFDYYLSTYDVDFSKPEKGGLSYEDLESLLDRIPARKKLLLIDACHSGELDKDEMIALNLKTDKLMKEQKGSIAVALKNNESNKRIGLKNSFELMQEIFVNVNKGTGATIIAASAGTQFAYEKGDLKNGVFTYSILNLMKEKNKITVSQLKNIVSKQVEKLTNGLQKPSARTENIENDWMVWSE